MEIIKRSSARALGLKKYFTGKACPHKHHAERYVSSGNCCECLRIHSISTPQKLARARDLRLIRLAKKPRVVRQKTPRQLAELSGALTFDGLECKFGHGRARYTKSGICVACSSDRHRDPKIVEYKKAWQKKNAARLKEQSAKNYLRSDRAAVIVRARQWVRDNPEQRRAIAAAYKARRKTQVQDGDSASTVGAWLKSAVKKCHWCGVTCAKKYHIDHYVPLARGGKHEVSNLVIACPGCNMSKNAKDPYEFAASVGRLF